MLNFNRYAYCFGNPVRYADPTGEYATYSEAFLMRDQAVKAGYNPSMIYNVGDQWLFNTYEGGQTIGINSNRTDFGYDIGTLMAVNQNTVNNINKIVNDMTKRITNSFNNTVDVSEIVQNVLEKEIYPALQSNEASYIGASLSGAGEHFSNVSINRGAYQSGLSKQRFIQSGNVSMRTPIGNLNISAKTLNTARIVGRVGGTGLGIVGVYLTFKRIGESHNNYDLYGEGGLDLVMGAIGLVPGWGWVISGSYFLGKASLEYTGNDFWNK